MWTRSPSPTRQRPPAVHRRRDWGSSRRWASKFANECTSPGNRGDCGLDTLDADAVLGGIWAPLAYRRIGREYVSFAQITGACPLVLVACGAIQTFTWEDMDGRVVVVPGGGHCAGFLALASCMRSEGYDITRTRPLHDLSESLSIELFAGGIGDFLVAPRLPSLRLIEEFEATIVASIAAGGGQAPWSVDDA